MFSAGDTSPVSSRTLEGRTKPWDLYFRGAVCDPPSPMYVCPECGTSAAQQGHCPRDGAPLRLADDPLLGQVLGSYYVARLVGAGGMGRVYLGVHPQIQSRVAIKVLGEECSKDRGLVERFFTEARAVNVIRHESIVNVLDINQLPNGQSYIVMELLEGDSLADLIRRGPIPLGELSRLLVQVLGGLGAAHQKGIIHRDLKPDNVFVTRAGRAKILDFGIAKLVPELGAVSEGTRTGALIGTPFYMAPEQALARPVDARSDLYSVGIILYEAVTGRRPFQGATLYELLKQHVELEPPPPSSMRGDIPPALEAVIRRAMAKNPSHRFQSAGEFARALEESSLGASGAAGYSHPGSPPWTGAAPTPSHSPPGYAASSGAPVAHTPAGAPTPGYGGAYGAPGYSPPVPGYAPPVGAAPSPPPFVPTPPAAPIVRSSTPLLAAVGCGALLVVVVAVALVVMLTGKKDVVALSSPPGETGSVEEAPEPTPEVVKSPSSVFSRVEASFDPKHFDAVAFQKQAEAAAREQLPDAVMVATDLMGVNSEGIINFELGSGSQALYRFRSEARSKPPADFPSNATFSSNCVVYVLVQGSGVNTFVPDKSSCNTPLTGVPRCSAREVWSKAVKQGGPRGNLIGNLGFNGDMMLNKKLRWYVTIPPDFSAVIDDDC